MNYYRDNRGTNRFLPAPPTWEEYEAAIEWTPVTDVFTMLDATARATLRNTADALAAQYTILAAFTEGDAYHDTDINDFRMLSGRVQDVMAEVVMLMRYLGEDPQ